MDETMKELLEECEEILLEVQILGEDFPKIKEMYENVLSLSKKLELNVKEHISALDSRATEIKNNIKQQEKENEKAEQTLKEVNKTVEKLDRVVTQIESVNQEQQKVSRALADNIEKVQDLSELYKKAIANLPSVDTNKLKFDYFEKEIAGIKKQLNDSKTAANDSRESLVVAGFYKARQEKLEKEIEELKKLIKNSNFPSSGGSTKKSLNEIKRELGVPCTAKCMTLDEEPNCTRHKPYGVLIDGKYIEADAWTVLMESFAIYCFKEYDNKNDVVDIVDEEYDDGYGHFYFIKGPGGANYNYISNYKISLYKPGADETVRMMQALCEYYELDDSEIKLFYYKK